MSFPIFDTYEKVTSLRGFVLESKASDDTQKVAKDFI